VGDGASLAPVAPLYLSSFPLRSTVTSRSGSCRIACPVAPFLSARPRSLPLGHGARDQHDEARRHRDRHFRFDGQAHDFPFNYGGHPDHPRF
jgi:hypothetical protein